MTAVPPREVREIVIGAVGVAVLIAILALSYGRGAGGGGQPPGTIRLTAEFDQVDGLDVGDPVLMSGVGVGRVAAFALTDDYRARVTLDVNSEAELFADAAVAIHTDGLFGGKFLRVDPGGGESRRLGDGDTITYTQKAFLVSEILDLIVAAGRTARTAAAQPPAPQIEPAPGPGPRPSAVEPR